MNKTAVILFSLLVAGTSFAGADSLFPKDAESRGSLVADSVRQFKEGDIITVLVHETIDADTQSNTHTKKEPDVEMKAPSTTNSFLTNSAGYNVLSVNKLPNWDLSGTNEHKASGQTTRKNRLIMTLACTVTRVYDNGNVEIQGTKQVTVNREDSRMEVRGIVRSKDVTPRNTIDSTQIANAEVKLIGRGPLWNNQRRGLITKLLDWFSPF